MTMSKTALVTGGMGFLGTNLCLELKKRGYDVIAYDTNLWDRLSLFEKNGIEVRHKDVLDLPPLLAAAKGVDVVFHLATMCLPFSFKEPHYTLDVATKGTLNAFYAAHKNNAFFVYCSSSEVYGEALPPHSDICSRLMPTTIYGAAKLAGEYVTEAYARIHNCRDKYVIVRPFNCYSADTEILTENGYSLFPERTAEKVATLNPSTGFLEYQQPTAKQSYYYKGPMIKVQGRRTDLLVTPDHRIFQKKRWGTLWEFMQAKELLQYQGKRAIQFKADTKWQGSLSPIAQMRVPTEDWLDFLAWYLSEGNIIGLSGVRIRQTNTKNIDAIATTAKKLSYDPHITYGENGQVVVYNRSLANYLKQFGTSWTKFIPNEVKALPTNLIAKFLHTYARGDGTFNSDGSIEAIYSVSDRMLDDLSELALKAGYSPTLTTSEGRTTKQLYLRSTAEKQPLPRQEDNFTQVYYEGMVHCVTVPNGIIYVRRNGKGVWCGNCYGEYAREDLYATVVTNFVKSHLTKAPAVIHGDGKQTRDFNYVQDIVDGLITAYEKNDRLRLHPIVNLCSGVETSLEQLWAEVGKAALLMYTALPMYKFQPQLMYDTQRKGDIQRMVGDPLYARTVINWESKHTLLGGLTEYIRWMASK